MNKHLTYIVPVLVLILDIGNSFTFYNYRKVRQRSTNNY